MWATFTLAYVVNEVDAADAPLWQILLVAILWPLIGPAYVVAAIRGR
jgi:hypothetical protein